MSEPHDLDRRHFLAVAASTIAAYRTGRGDRRHMRYRSMTDVMPEVAPRARADKSDIRPFHASFPDSDLVELRLDFRSLRGLSRS